MADKKIAVLYVDDEENNLMSFRANFRLKYQVYTAKSGDEALHVLADNDIEIIITDQRMPGMTGVEFLENVLNKFPGTVRILLTGYADMEAVVDAVNKGKIFHYLSKPWDEQELDKTIQKAFDEYKEKEKVRKMNDTLAESNQQMEFLLRQKLLS